MISNLEQNQLEALTDSIPLMAWISGGDGQVYYHNKRWDDYTGNLNFQNCGWQDVIHPDDMQSTMDQWRHSIETGNDFLIEYRLKRFSDGMYRWHLGKAVANRDANGFITNWFGTATDIHEQKITSEKLILSESLLKEAQELAHILILFFFFYNKKLYWSDELFRVLGYQPDEFEPTFEIFIETVHPEDLKKVYTSVDKIKLDQFLNDLNYRIIRPDGKIRIISASKRVICDEYGIIKSLRGTCHDITELKESQRFIQQISNASPGIIAVYDLNLKRNIYVNREINVVLGYSEEEKSEITYHVYEKIVHPDDQQMFFNFLKSALDFTDEETREVECRIKNAKGEWLWFMIRMKVFKRDVYGKVYQLIGIGQEVTDRKKLEEEAVNFKLSQQKEILNAILNAQESERERIGEALHNGLGQLLYAIKLNLENYRNKLGIDIKRDKTLINEITGLLADSIDETRRISFELMPGVLKDFGLEIALKEMTKKLSKDFNVLWNIYGINQRLSEDLEIAIFRIIQELINNSIKHGKVKEARIDLIKVKNIINILVEDHGEGFDIDQMKDKGTGLQTIKNRIKLLNGIIGITSKLGLGTQVVIEIDALNYSK
jgi:two-component system NarL family sensor kinase